MSTPSGLKGDPLLAKLNQEIEEYSEIMNKIESNLLVNLEGLQYGKSNTEHQFTTFSVLALVMVFFLMLAHSFLKYKRFQHNNWKPNINTTTLAEGISMPLRLIEHELAPTLFIVTFLISVGGFYFFELFLLLVIIGVSIYLFQGYRFVD